MQDNKKETTVKEEKKVFNRPLTEQQEQYCMLVATQGMEPLEAMLTAYPSRKTYARNNQLMLLNKMKKHPQITARLEELYKAIQEHEVLGDVYNFEKGAQYLNEEINNAKKAIEEKGFSEAMHRVILTSVQELNRMYGFNLIDKNGNSKSGMNVTFINVKNEGDVVVESKE